MKYKALLKESNYDTKGNEELNNIDITKLKGYKKTKGYYIIKRIIDMICSGIGLVILSPLFIIISIAIKLDSKGPVLFSQRRVGKDGKEFEMYKLRSMIVNAEELLEILEDENEMSGPMFKIKEDPRITKVGKFIRKTSIDELPQLINIMKGDMSLVGPRPNLPNEVEEFEPWMKNKLIAKPGLTCYWQVLGRNEIDFLDWMRLDLKYIEDRSTALDIKLIFKTFKVFFGDEYAR
ncbi:sugar transferase [Clostridium algidicarnis]|uniref:sugar transferase n=1 Tax=Clostridium algidicarnis TaxID=37659 RepID=UPI000A062216